MIKYDFKLWWFPERSHSSTNKNSHFLGLEKVTTFMWYPTIITVKLEYFTQVKTFWRPLIWLPPQTPGLDPPLFAVGFLGQTQQLLVTTWEVSICLKKDRARESLGREKLWRESRSGLSYSGFEWLLNTCHET